MIKHARSAPGTTLERLDQLVPGPEAVGARTVIGSAGQAIERVGRIEHEGILADPLLPARQLADYRRYLEELFLTT